MAQYTCKTCGYETDKVIDFRNHLLAEKNKTPSTRSTSDNKQQPEVAVAVQEPEAKAEAKAPEAKPQKPPKQPKEKRKIDTRRTLFIVGGVGLVMLGCVITAFMATNMRGNPLVIFGMAIVILGGYLGFKGIRGESSMGGTGTGWNPMKSGKKELVDVTVPKPKGNENCLRICPDEKGGSGFESVEKPQGFPWVCDNDNRHYFIEQWKPEDEAIGVFELPEFKYFSPKEFANIVDAEPIRRFFENHNDRLEKMAPWIFLAMCGIFLIAVLTIPGALQSRKEEASLWPMIMNLI